jgi:riboflavin synthase
MFSGIIDHCGKVTHMNRVGQKCFLEIACQFDDLTAGESIAVDGICLTVTSFQAPLFKVDVSPETLSLTNIASYQEATWVNIERSLRLQDRLGGHFVTGHIDQQCQVTQIQPQEEFLQVTFSSLLPEYRGYLIKKGSIAINGVSLTINQVFADSFQVMLIPHTLERTNLVSLQINHWVNIEYDYLGKLVYNQMQCSERQ